MNYFKDARTRKVAAGQRVPRVPLEIQRRAVRQLSILSAAQTLQDVRFAGGGRIAKARGTKPARLYLHVNGPWWIGFTWERTDALDVSLEKH